MDDAGDNCSHIDRASKAAFVRDLGIKRSESALLGYQNETLDSCNH